MNSDKKHLDQLAKLCDKYLKEEDYEAAQKCADELYKRDLSAGLAYRGVIALRKSDYATAEKLLLEAYKLNSKQNLAIANLIPTYLKLKDFKKAIQFGEIGYQRLPANITVAINYAAALLQEQQYEEAKNVLSAFENEDEPNIAVLTGLISAYRGLFDKDKADALMLIAEKHYPDKPEILRLKADLESELNPEKALRLFEDLVEKNPNSITTRWNMSLVQLRCGAFAEGWINYDNGLTPEVGKIGRPLPKLFLQDRLILSKDNLDRHKWTVIVSEQGIGDQVLFLSVLSEFLREYPKTILVCEKRMEPILRRSFPELTIYTYGVGQLLYGLTNVYNGHVPLGSLPKHYRKSPYAFESNKKTYLLADSKKTEYFRTHLLKKTQAKRLIGFSWKGGFWERAQRTKTLELEHWAPLLNRQDIIFVSLQYGDTSKEQEYCENRFPNVKWIKGVDFKRDLDSWFALACACDEIVSVSTALVHFVGAAGRKVNLLLGGKGAPFIWGLAQENSIVYEHVKINRLASDQTITDFFERIAKNI